MMEYGFTGQRYMSLGRRLCRISLLSFALAASQGVSGAQEAGPASPSNVLTHALAELTGDNTAMIDITMKGYLEYSAGSTHDSGSVAFKAGTGGYSSTVVTRSSEVMQEIRRNDPGGLSGTSADAQGIHTLSGRNLLREPYWFSPELLLKAVSGPGWTIVDEQTATRNGIDLCDLTLQRTVDPKNALSKLIQHESMFHLIVDPRTFSVIEISYREASPLPRFSGPLVIVQYGDYKDVQGHSMPFHIVKLVNGSASLDIRLTHILLNQGLTLDTFNLQ